MRRTRLETVLVPLLLFMPASRGAAQRSATVAIQGTVVDAESGNLVINATAAVTNLRRQTRVDSLGAFALRGLAPGSHFVLVSAPGYEPVAELVEAGADTDMGRIELSPAVYRLAPINVVASAIETRYRRSPYQKLAYTEDVLAHSGDSDMVHFVLRRIGGYFTACNFLPPPPGVPANAPECVRVRGYARRIAVYIDEAPAAGGFGQLQIYRPEEIGRVEIYQGGMLVMVYTRGYLAMMAHTRLRALPMPVYK